MRNSRYSDVQNANEYKSFRREQEKLKKKFSKPKNPFAGFLGGFFEFLGMAWKPALMIAVVILLGFSILGVALLEMALCIAFGPWYLFGVIPAVFVIALLIYSIGFVLSMAGW